VSILVVADGIAAFDVYVLAVDGSGVCGVTQESFGACGTDGAREAADGLDHLAVHKSTPVPDQGEFSAVLREAGSPVS